MNNAHSPSTSAQRLADRGIAWEALPSLSHLLDLGNARRDAPTWEETRPADLDTLGDMAPFRETLEGLAVREMHEPEIFNALFGGA